MLRFTRSFSTSLALLHKPNAKKKLAGSGTIPQRAGQANDRQVYLDWNARKTSVFHNFWLRDHCRCESCYHPETRQRLVDTFSIPRDIQPIAVDSTEVGLEVTWPDSHKSVYAWDWLHTHSYSPVLQSAQSLDAKRPQLWGADHKQPTIPYEAVMHTQEGLAQWLDQLETFGLSFVDGVPKTAEATKALANRISFIRPTHYAPGLWSFTSDLSHADTAYTKLALDAHTDTTSFTEPVGLQMFHKTEFDGQGGLSLFVDGFKVARDLKEASAEAYRVLSTTRVPTHSAGDHQVFILPTPRAFPILNHTPDGSLFQIRYNNSDRSTLDHLSSVQLEEFYDALFLWRKILTDQKNELWDDLAPGRVATFDNWRILHGRTAFTGHRRMCGAYLPWDDYKSRVRSIRFSNLDKDRLL